MSCSESYDNNRLPPAPCISVRLENPVSEKTLQLRFYIDTGFDGTLILNDGVWRELELWLSEVDRDVYAMHAGYLPVRLRPALVNVAVCGRTFKHVEVYLHPFSRRLLIGRELIKNFYIILEGPESRLKLSADPFA